MKLDESMWPIALFTMGREASDEDWRRMFTAYDGFYARKQLFCTITDGTGMQQFPSAGQRKLIAELSREREPQARRWCVNGAVVLPNAVARGVMMALSWLAPPVNAQTFHPTLDEALEETVRALEAKGLAVPVAAKRLSRPARTASR